MREKRKPTPTQLRFQQIYDEYVAPNLPPLKPLASPCLGKRRKHYFREPNTQSLTSDLKCKWCGKTVAQARAEQRTARIKLIEKKHRSGERETCAKCHKRIKSIWEPCPHCGYEHPVTNPFLRS